MCIDPCVSRVNSVCLCEPGFYYGVLSLVMSSRNEMSVEEIWWLPIICTIDHLETLKHC